MMKSKITVHKGKKSFGRRKARRILRGFRTGQDAEKTKTTGKESKYLKKAE